MTEAAVEQVERLARRHGWRYVRRRLGANVVVEEGGRRQTVRVRFREGTCRISATVVSRPRMQADDGHRRELAKLAWRRNAAGELVTLGFDKRDRLVGHVRHPIEHLDDEELEAYLLAVAREADRFEYLLGGEDRH